MAKEPKRIVCPLRQVIYIHLMLIDRLSHDLLFEKAVVNLALRISGSLLCWPHFQPFKIPGPSLYPDTTMVQLSIYNILACDGAYKLTRSTNQHDWIGAGCEISLHFTKCITVAVS